MRISNLPQHQIAIADEDIFVWKDCKTLLKFNNETLEFAHITPTYKIMNLNCTAFDVINF